MCPQSTKSMSAIQFTRPCIILYVTDTVTEYWPHTMLSLFNHDGINRPGMNSWSHPVTTSAIESFNQASASRRRYAAQRSPIRWQRHNEKFPWTMVHNAGRTTAAQMATHSSSSSSSSVDDTSANQRRPLARQRTPGPGPAGPHGAAPPLSASRPVQLRSPPPPSPRQIMPDKSQYRTDRQAGAADCSEDQWRRHGPPTAIDNYDSDWSTHVHSTLLTIPQYTQLQATTTYCPPLSSAIAATVQQYIWHV